MPGQKLVDKMPVIVQIKYSFERFEYPDSILGGLLIHTGALDAVNGDGKVPLYFAVFSSFGLIEGL